MNGPNLVLESIGSGLVVLRKIGQTILCLVCTINDSAHSITGRSSMSASEMVHSPFGSHLHTRGCCYLWDGLMKTSTSHVQKCCSHIPGGSSLHEATASFPLQKWPAAGDHRSQCSAHTLQTCGNVHTHTKTNTVKMFGQPTVVKTNDNQPALSIRSPVKHLHFEMETRTCHTVSNQAELTGCRYMFPQRTSSIYIPCTLLMQFDLLMAHLKFLVIKNT